MKINDLPWQMYFNLTMTLWEAVVKIDFIAWILDVG